MLNTTSAETAAAPRASDFNTRFNPVTETTEFQTGDGDITLNAEVNTNIETGSSQKYLSSLAVGVAVPNADVTFKPTSIVNAKGDVNASAKVTS